MEKLVCQKNQLSHLIKKYVDASVKHGKSTESGDSNLANEHYFTLEKLYKEIISIGEEGRKALTDLFEHKDPYVRLWSATHSLNYSQSKAKKVLKKLQKEPGFVSITAEMTIIEWKKGNLKLE